MTDISSNSKTLIYTWIRDIYSTLHSFYSLDEDENIKYRFSEHEKDIFMSMFKTIFEHAIERVEYKSDDEIQCFCYACIYFSLAMCAFNEEEDVFLICKYIRKLRFKKEQYDIFWRCVVSIINFKINFLELLNKECQK